MNDSLALMTLRESTAVVIIVLFSFSLSVLTMRAFHAFLFAAVLASSAAFTPVCRNGVDKSVDARQYSTCLWSTPEKKKPYDEKLRKKLLSESIAPWRTIRLFLYGSLGSGAFVGGFIQLTGLLAALSAGKEGIDMNTEVRTKPHDF